MSLCPLDQSTFLTNPLCDTLLKSRWNPTWHIWPRGSSPAKKKQVTNPYLEQWKAFQILEKNGGIWYKGYP